ncbi:EAL domain-containing protein [Zoogloeaceae bacteirum Par-f-2]|nr:EAL domain-containing protein [Zoogloeaceae bacteirum Par-f-2]
MPSPAVHPRGGALPDFSTLHGRARRLDQRLTIDWAGYRLCSHLQPIVSFSHRRVVGYEGLIRATDTAGHPVPPPTLLRQADTAVELIGLDRSCRYVHIGQAAAFGIDGYLFLNMHPLAFASMQVTDCARFMRETAAAFCLPPERLVIEITEDALTDDSSFEASVRYLRELGCRVALDDFGAGHSNFDRVWRLKPEIVKLDRDFALRAAADESARRLLPQIVELLHEAGSLVLLEGIETAEQARIAMAADVDFAQGYLFGRPSGLAPEEAPTVAVIDTVWADYDNSEAEDRRRYRARINDYVNAIGHAAALLADRRSTDEALQLFLGQPGALRCYILDEQGFQISRNIPAQGERRAAGITPETDVARARWSRRPYFRRALESPGRVCVTRPYLCISSAVLCVTVSICYRVDGQRRVLCGDVLWD